MGKYNKYKTGNIISIYYLWVVKETKYGIIGNTDILAQILHLESLLVFMHLIYTMQSLTHKYIKIIIYITKFYFYKPKCCDGY